MKVLSALLQAGALVVLALVAMPVAANAKSDDVSFVGRGMVIEEITLPEDTTEVRIQRTEGDGVLQEIIAKGFDWDQSTGSTHVTLYRPKNGDAATLKVTVRNPNRAGVSSVFKVRTRGAKAKVELPSVGGALQGTLAWGAAPPAGDGLLGAQISRRLSGGLNLETDLGLGFEDHSSAEISGVGAWSPGYGWNERILIGPAWRPQEGAHVWLKGGVSLSSGGRLADRPALIDIGLFSPLDPFDGMFEWGGRTVAQLGPDPAVGMEVKGFYSLARLDWIELLAGVKVEAKLAKSRFVTIIPELQPVFRTSFGTFRTELGYGLDSWTGQPAARVGVSLLQY